MSSTLRNSSKAYVPVLGMVRDFLGKVIVFMAHDRSGVATRRDSDSCVNIPQSLIYIQQLATQDRVSCVHEPVRVADMDGHKKADVMLVDVIVWVESWKATELGLVAMGPKLDGDS